MTTRRAIILCSLGAVITALASLMIGPATISPTETLATLFGGGDTIARTIILDIRLPRMLAAFLAGAALGASGAALQGLLRNPLADPGVLGVSSAAALGAVIAVYFNLAAIAAIFTPLAAMLGALGAVALLMTLGAGRVSTARLILVGVGISSFAGALIALVMNFAPNPFVLSDLVNWLFGTVANRSFDDLLLTTPVMLAGFALLFVSRAGLSALTLGEEAALTLGANVERTRIFVILGTALLVGASVALAGAIGFVGVVAPHVVRPLFGHDPARIILPSALAGGAALVLADLLIRLAPFDQEMKLGVAAALIGAPGFIWIAARTRRLAA